jgi:hypothetical protein
VFPNQEKVTNATGKLLNLNNHKIQFPLSLQSPPSISFSPLLVLARNETAESSLEFT